MSLDQTIAEIQKVLNIITRIGYLGNGASVVRDTANLGNLFVRIQQADGRLSSAVSMPVHPNANIQVTDGWPVRIGYDEDQTELIISSYLPGVKASGSNPYTLNPLDNAAHGFTPQSQIATFYAERSGDTINKPLYVVIFPATVVTGTTTQVFPGDEVDLSGEVPASGLHGYTVIFWKTDNTLEVFSSTPINLGDPLTEADLEEAINQRTSGSLPLWAFELADGQTILTQDATKRWDLRQFVNVTDESGGGSGITQLTGDVTAGPGSGSQAATLANSGVSAGSYTNASVTFDAKGRATAASSGAAPVTSVTGTPPIASSGGATPAISLNDTAVTPGSYTYTSLTVDQKGRLTAASNGTAPAPANATYITQTADGTLSAEQALSSLATGLMKVTTTTGVVSSITDSAGLAGVISDETGSGALVFGTSPTLATPTVSGEAVTDFIDYTEASTPSTPASNHARVWAADDNGFTRKYWIDSTGIISLDQRDIIITAENLSGSTRAAGFPVQLGSNGGHIAFTTASITGSSQFNACSGVLMESTANGSYGRVMLAGIMVCDTSGFSANAALYLTSSGTLSATPPTAGTGFKQIVAKVLTSSATGLLHVLLQKPFEFENSYYSTVNIGTGSAATLAFYGTSTRKGLLTFAALTADRTATFPDATGNVVLDSATQTLTNKTLTAPTMADFTNANHDHLDADDGGTLDAAAIASGTFSEARLPHKFAVIEEQQAQNTAGGGSTATTWTTRVINTEVADADNLVTLSSNKFTPISGTYRIYCSSPFVGNAAAGAGGRLRLRNVTSTTVLFVSANHLIQINQGCNMTFLTEFTANGTDEFDVQYYITAARATNGLGLAVNEASAVERYTQITLEKIA